MTFTLKNFHELKTALEREIRVKLNSKKVESADKLPDDSPRKNEIFFLQEVLYQIQKEATEREEEEDVDYAQYAKVLMGAMLLIQKDIQDHLGFMESPQSSLLFRSLSNVMGTNPKSMPDNHQLVDYFSSLNEFMNVIYVKGDSRKGLLVRDRPFNTIPLYATKGLSGLVDFLNKSFSLENQARSEVLKGYGNNGTKAKENYLSTLRRIPIPVSVTDALASYNVLKHQILDTIEAERGHKQAADMSELQRSNPDRGKQLHLLDILLTALQDDNALADWDEPQSQALLTGAMLLVREQIGLSYGYKALAIVEISSSIVHPLLNEHLKIKDMKPEDACALISFIRRFIYLATIERTLTIDGKVVEEATALKVAPKKSDMKESESEDAQEDQVEVAEKLPKPKQDKTPEKPGIEVLLEAVRVQHVFSDIPGFKVVPILDFCDQLITNYKMLALDRCATPFKKQEESYSYAGAILNMVGSLYRRPAPPQEEGKKAEVGAQAGESTSTTTNTTTSLTS